MPADVEHELRLAVSAGVLARAEADELRASLDPGGPGLFARLEAEGRISPTLRAELLSRMVADTLELTTNGAGATTFDQRAPRARPVSQPSYGGFPIPGWDRYEPVRVLGEGGMGRVFLARDPRLDRLVAMKFVRNDDPEQAGRVVAEAKAQARVQDERVCKVFEVGEIEGRVYIAMQFVDGKPLTELVDELTYEQKALVIQGAALGVHEAHRAGLIHRDLKPSNIMVERGADGSLRPFVMDFGIARDWDQSATATGTVLGTPQFMAPEQARGEIKQLDRRADVYALGATLYAFLTGKAPIDGDNPLVVLNRISLDEPPRPRTLDRDLPLDLEAIVMKCLEKERGARYDSARALADDLQRFLDGAPVEARASAGWTYRLRKAARRHWRALAVALAMVVIAGGALGYGLRQRAIAERRAAIVRDYTERVEHIDALARYSALAPAHPLAGDQDTIRAMMSDLRDEIRAGGALAVGPGHYALGRGYLALGELPEALAELEQAWSSGFRGPRVAYALALTEGRLYQEGLRKLAALPAAIRDQRRPELERRYRDPARDHLRASVGTDVPSRAYVSALLAYYDGRFDDALRELDTIDSKGAALAWFYEVPLLRGEILHRQLAVERGTAPPEVQSQRIDAARTAFATAAAIGESAPEVFLAVAEFEQRLQKIELYGTGHVEDPYQRALAAADRVILLDPGRYEAYVIRSHASRSMAEHRNNLAEDATPFMAAAIADARKAVDLAPEHTDAVVELASCLRQDGKIRQTLSQDPSAPLEQAIALLVAIPREKRDDLASMQLGLAHKIWADALDEAGADASAHRQAAIEAYLDSLNRNPSYGESWLNLGINYVERARQVQANTGDPLADLDRAVEALERGRALLPQSLVPDFYEGDAYALRADHLAATGGDPEPDRAKALERYRHGLTINPDIAVLHNGIAIVETARGVAAMAQGRDPSGFLDQAEAAARRGIAAAPDQGHAYNNLAEALRHRAAYQAQRGADPGPLAREATAALENALARIPNHPEFLRNLARVELLVADYQVAHGRDPRAELDRARGWAQRLLARAPDDPRNADVMAALARLTRR